MAFTSEQIFNMNGERAVLTVLAGGGGVTISIEHSPGVYVVLKTIMEDSAHEIFAGRSRLKVTPINNGSYNLHR